MTALLLTLTLLTPARADDLSLRVGVGWVTESAAAGGAISGVSGMALGELERFRGGFSIGYRLGSGWTLEYTHWSGHAQPAALFRQTFYDLEQANSVVLWRRLR